MHYRKNIDFINKLIYFPKNKEIMFKNKPTFHIWIMEGIKVKTKYSN